MATHQLSQPDMGWKDARRTGPTSNAATSQATPADYVSNATLDAKLLASGYTQKQIDSLTQNDKVYAVRIIDDPTSIKP
jgi:hypothetical protein